MRIGVVLTTPITLPYFADTAPVLALPPSHAETPALASLEEAQSPPSPAMDLAAQTGEPPSPTAPGLASQSSPEAPGLTVPSTQEPTSSRLPVAAVGPKTSTPRLPGASLLPTKERRRNPYQHLPDWKEKEYFLAQVAFLLTPHYTINHH